MSKEKNKWLRFRRQWLKNNPPSHSGYYTCGICGQWVHESEVSLDHITPQGWGHVRKYDPENIQPTHSQCNLLKGSKRI